MNLSEQGLVRQCKRGGSLTTDKKGEVFTDRGFLSPILIEIMNLLEQGLVRQLKRGGSLTIDRIGEVYTDRGFLSPFLLGGGQEIVNLLIVDLKERNLHIDLHL